MWKTSLQTNNHLIYLELAISQRKNGHGAPSVANVYGEDAYVSCEFYIDVIIHFNKDGPEITTRKN